MSAGRLDAIHPVIQLAASFARMWQGGAALVDEVALAVGDERGYRARFGTRLAERGAVSTSQLPWLALVDALLCSGRAVENDGREEPGAVRAAIRRLVSASSLELPRVRIASASTASEALASSLRATTLRSRTSPSSTLSWSCTRHHRRPRRSRAFRSTSRCAR